MPESNVSATDASLQVGATELTPRPTVAPNVINIDDTAHATRAPATTDVHCNVQPLSAGRSAASVFMSASMLMAGVLAKAKEREDCQDDYNQTHQVKTDHKNWRCLLVAHDGGIRMYHIDDPNDMSPEQRFIEIAAILTKGYIRLKKQETSEKSHNSEVLLDSSAHQSAHGNTVNTKRERS